MEKELAEREKAGDEALDGDGETEEDNGEEVGEENDDNVHDGDVEADEDENEAE